MPWAGVIGSPIEHSLSPVLHEAAWAGLGLSDWTYSRFCVDEGGVAGFLSALPEGFAGLSVTMPCKQAIIALLDAVDPLAVAVGSVNTVVPAGGMLAGFNTDVAGIHRALEGALPPPGSLGAPAVTSALILGGGATAASALAAVGGMGVQDIRVAARRFGGPTSILTAATRLGLSITQVPWASRDQVVAQMGDVDIVVSTMPAHVCDSLAPLVQVRPGQVLLDVVYSPLTTDLVAAWRAGGGTTAHGLDMLVNQAVDQVKLMTGRDGDPALMRAALEVELAARAESAD